MADLVGKEARRVLSEGRPVTETSVGEPLVVERNRPVSLVYTVGDLRITAKGRALADGSVGEAIRAVNEESHRTITGIVLAEGRSEEPTSELQSLMRITYAVFC